MHCDTILSCMIGKGGLLQSRVCITEILKRSFCTHFNHPLQQKNKKINFDTQHHIRKHYYEDPNWNPHSYFYKELAAPFLKVTCLSLVVFYSLKYIWWLLDSSEHQRISNVKQPIINNMVHHQHIYLFFVCLLISLFTC